MPLNIQCSQCSETLRLRDDSYLGKKVRCPKCQEVFTVRSSSRRNSPSPARQTEKSPLYLDDVEDDLIDDWEDNNWDDFEETESRSPKTKKRPSKKKRRKKKSLNLDDEYEKIRRNIRAIAFIYAFFGGLFGLCLISVRQNLDQPSLGLFLIILFGFACFSGISILTRQPWGIICCKIVSVFYMFAFPIGTLLGGYFLFNVDYVEDEFT